MSIIVDQVCVDGNVWLVVGSNTPWIIGGTITEIFITKNDPRNYYGCDADFIEVSFDNKKKLTIKTSEYMYVERVDGG